MNKLASYGLSCLVLIAEDGLQETAVLADTPDNIDCAQIVGEAQSRLEVLFGYMSQGWKEYVDSDGIRWFITQLDANDVLTSRCFTADNVNTCIFKFQEQNSHSIYTLDYKLDDHSLTLSSDRTSNLFSIKITTEGCQIQNDIDSLTCPEARNDCVAFNTFHGDLMGDIGVAFEMCGR